MSDQRPELDQQEGTTAASEAAQARADVLEAIRLGEMTLAGLFDAADKERESGGGSGHRVFGHTHLRTALLALPGIGEIKAFDIMRDLGLQEVNHIDELGSNQRLALYEAVGDPSVTG